MFALTVAYWLPVAPLGISIYDEGLRVYGAERILAGDRPYRDFLAYYGPGEYYWPAFLFALFGKQLIVFRLGGVVMGGVLAVSLWALARNAGVAASWAFVAVAAFLLPITTGQALYICGPAMALAFAGGAVVTGGAPAGGALTGGAPAGGALTGSAHPGRGRLFAAGALFGSAMVFRPDFGGCGLLAGALAALVMLAGRRVGFLLLGAASVALPAYGALALDGVARLVYSLVVVPKTTLPYRRMLTLYPIHDVYRSLRAAVEHAVWLDLAYALTQAIVYVAPPAFALALIAALLVSTLRRRLFALRPRTAALVFVVVEAVGLTSYALIRFDFQHVLPLFVASACGLAIVAGAMVEGLGTRGRLVGRLIAEFAVIALLVAQLSIVVRTASYVPLAVDRGALIRVPLERLAVADAVRDLATAPPGRILAGCTRHDRVHTSPVMLYFLSGRASATYLHDYFPHVQAMREVQEGIVRDLTTHGVRTVLAWRCTVPDEPNLSRHVRGASLLDEVLRAEFTTVRERPSYTLLTR